MSDGPAKRIRVQFKLAALFVLTAVVGASLALARLLAPLDAQFVDIFLVELAPPFVVGVGVGLVCRSRAQLLTAPSVAAAISPLVLAAVAAMYDPSILSPSAVSLAELLKWWAMAFVLFFFVGAIPALAGSALGYWFKRQCIVRSI
jgi:hypothetical protein